MENPALLAQKHYYLSQRLGLCSPNTGRGSKSKQGRATHNDSQTIKQSLINNCKNHKRHNNHKIVKNHTKSHTINCQLLQKSESESTQHHASNANVLSAPLRKSLFEVHREKIFSLSLKWASSLAEKSLKRKLCTPGWKNTLLALADDDQKNNIDVSRSIFIFSIQYMFEALLACTYPSLYVSAWLSSYSHLCARPWLQLTGSPSSLGGGSPQWEAAHYKKKTSKMYKSPKCTAFFSCSICSWRDVQAA